MIYLDNAATTEYKPREVLEAVNNALTVLPYSAKRGGNKKSLEIEQKLYELRQKIASLVGGDSDRVILTSGCTHALNQAVFGVARRGNVIVSATEHNSVLRTVFQLQKRGFCTVSVVYPDERGIITAESVQKLMQKDTFLVCVSHASNVTGTLQTELAEISKVAHENGALLLVDGAQTVGYADVNVTESGIDLFAFGSHKGLHSMQGAGALVVGKNVKLRPSFFGGTGSESSLLYQPSTFPDGFEAGTLPTPALLAMSASVDWHKKNKIANAENVKKAEELILQNLAYVPRIKVYSRSNLSGIVTLNVDGADSNDVANYLAERDVAVRGGLQCAPLMHKWLGTEQTGAVRVSVSCKTSRVECFAFLNVLDEFARKM